MSSQIDGGPAPQASASNSLLRAPPWIQAAASAAAALTVWGIVQRQYPFFSVPNIQRAAGRGPTGPSSEEIALLTRVAYANATALVTLAGGLFAVVLGVCQRVRGRSIASTVCCLIAAAVLGGAGGNAGGWCGQWLSELAALHQMSDTVRLFTIQGVCWSLAGLGVGLGAAILSTSTDNRRAAARKSAGGGLGGLLAGFVYLIGTALVGVLFPDVESKGLVPEAASSQLVWLVAAAVSIGMSVGGVKSLRPSVDERKTIVPLPATVVGGLIVVISAWSWQFGSATNSVPTASTHPEDDCPSASWKVAYADDESVEDRVAHLSELDATSRWIPAGGPFPDLRVEGWLNGHPDEADLRRKVLVVDVWDGMCIGCRQAAPCLVWAYKMFHDRGVTFVGLTAADRADAERFLANTEITWPNGYGAKPTLDELGSRVPTIYVIGRDGRIVWTDQRSRYVHHVASLGRELRKAIEDELGKEYPGGDVAPSLPGALCCPSRPVQIIRGPVGSRADCADISPERKF